MDQPARLTRPTRPHARQTEPAAPTEATAAARRHRPPARPASTSAATSRATATGTPSATPTPAPVDVHIVLLDDHVLLDWAGPAEVLRVARRLLEARGLGPVFTLHCVGPRPQARSSVGAVIADLAPLPDLVRAAAGGRRQWLMLVGQTGARIALDSAPARELLRWLRPLPLRAGHIELLCVCAGAVIAGHAGLLDGRAATTHHDHLDELRAAAPAAQVLDNRVFVLDGPVASSAGVSTGIDLMLHAVSAHLGPVAGPPLAAEIAQQLVLALRRGPQDAELSPFIAHRQHLQPLLHRVQDAVARDPRAAWTLETMAARAPTSTRHLRRLFRQHAGLAPMAWLLQLRLALAQAALRSGHGVGRAAELAGFSSDAQLRRAWQRAGLAGTPSSVRPEPGPC
ncbi:MAG: HTH-type transcriptional regulator CdhR [Pseudomonadota bacterium]